MGFKRKTNQLNLNLVLLIFFLLFIGFLYQQWQSSIILQEKDRLNIAVMAEIPFVYSLNLHQDVAIVTYFSPEYMVNVPGGYDWYRLGSLNLLGKIEKNRVPLLRSAFAELVGVPIDLVYYPQQAKVINKGRQTFNEYYDSFVKKELFSKSYRSSVNNFFDRFLAKKLFQVRQDHLLFVDTRDLKQQHNNRTYYYSEQLDTRLKGLFYHESIVSQAYKAVVVTDRDNYRQAERILRQLEGIGIKVIEIELKDKLEKQSCQISLSRDQQELAHKLARLFSCKVKYQKSAIIRYTL